MITAAGFAQPRRPEQQYCPLRPRDLPLPILAGAEPHTATGARGERMGSASAGIAGSLMNGAERGRP